MQIGEDGWTLDWGNDLEIPADALWRIALEQDGAAFRAWRRARGMTQEQAAAELSIGTRMIGYYEAGTHPIPRYITLARIGLDTLRAA